MPKLNDKQKLNESQIKAVMQHITRFPDLYYDAFVDIGFVVDVKLYESSLSSIDLNSLVRYFRTFGDDQDLWLQWQKEEFEVLNGLAQTIKDT